MKQFHFKNQRQRIVLNAFVVCILLLSYSAYTIVAGKVNVAVDELENSMKSDLPAGTSIVRVGKWLEKNNFVFDSTDFNPASKTPHKVLSGYFKNSRSGLYGMCSIYANFAFNEKGQLLRCSVNEVCTSL